jgi:hypothetical protein
MLDSIRGVVALTRQFEGHLSWQRHTTPRGGFDVGESLLIGRTRREMFYTIPVLEAI